MQFAPSHIVFVSPHVSQTSGNYFRLNCYFHHIKSLMWIKILAWSKCNGKIQENSTSLLTHLPLLQKLLCGISNSVWESSSHQNWRLCFFVFFPAENNTLALEVCSGSVCKVEDGKYIFLIKLIKRRVSERNIATVFTCRGFRRIGSHFGPHHDFRSLYSKERFIFLFYLVLCSGVILVSQKQL